MKLEQSFDVQAPIDVVWEALLDIEKIAPCLPGADITGHDDEGNYQGTFNIKLGPTNASYRGTLRIGDTDEAARRATLHARGTDKRGQGGATATIVNTLEAIDGATRVHADTDFTITGRLASFSRSGMIKDISNRLLREFSACLSETITYDQQQRSAAAPAGPDGDSTGAPTSGSGGDSTGTPAASESGGDTSGATASGAPVPADAPFAGEARGTAAEAATPPAPGGGVGTPAPPAAPATPAAGAASSPPATPPRARPQAKEIKAGSLFFSVLWERIRRLFGRGKP